MDRITESDSHYNDLEKMSVDELLQNINKEDAKVASAVQKVIPNISQFVQALIPRMREGGKLFYIGAGTSGRLGILDASECPPTFGVPHDWVIGLIAGGDSAIRKAVEFAEDDVDQAWKDLQTHGIQDMDTVIGIAASGTTPYVVNGLKESQKRGILTASITCNLESPVSQYADHRIEAIVGPEFVTGSTRMKSGTAQKLILNMISTSAMISLGRVKGNKMIDMELSNDKLVDRGTKMIMTQSNLTYDEAKLQLLKYGSVRDTLQNL